MIVLIDNYDSFTYNLYQYISEFAEVKIVRNDEITVDELRELKPNGIVISPGPCTPQEAGISIEVAKNFGDDIPVLGICLGHQSIGAAYGANIVRARQMFDGKSAEITVKGSDRFEGISRKVQVMRYHSLIIERASMPKELQIIAETNDEERTIMAVKHKTKKIYGLQFHPESVFTPKGKRMIRNFVEGICNEY